MAAAGEPPGLSSTWPGKAPDPRERKKLSPGSEAAPPSYGTSIMTGFPDPSLLSLSLPSPDMCGSSGSVGRSRQAALETDGMAGIILRRGQLEGGSGLLSSSLGV